MTLYAHQKEIIDADPKKALIAHGTGSGKTRTALCLAKGGTLVIAPKQQALDKTWQREKEKLGVSVNLTVISKEQFRKKWRELPRFDTVIGEEAHTLLGITPNVRYRNKKPIPKASQIFEALLAYVQENNPSRLYLITATPTRTPMCVFAAGVLLGAWSIRDFYQFRDAFYIKLPIAGREAWKPREDKETKERLGRAVQKLGYTARLEDLFDVPEQTYKVDTVGLTKEQKNAIKDLPLAYPDPLVLLGKTHQAEQGVGGLQENKSERIYDLAVEFERIAVFARYREQIENLNKYLTKKSLRVVTLTGDTKDRETAIKKANDGAPCVFICQSQIGAGFELPDYPCAVFASLDFSYVNYAQNCGRILRANKLGKKLYVTLLSGDIDKAVHKALTNKKDFAEHIYAREKLSDNRPGVDTGE